MPDPNDKKKSACVGVSFSHSWAFEAKHPQDWKCDAGSGLCRRIAEPQGFDELVLPQIVSLIEKLGVWRKVWMAFKARWWCRCLEAALVRSARNTAHVRDWMFLGFVVLTHFFFCRYFKSPGAGLASGRIPLEGTKLEVVTETEFTVVAEYRAFELSAESDAEAKARKKGSESLISFDSFFFFFHQGLGAKYWTCSGCKDCTCRVLGRELVVRLF